MGYGLSIGVKSLITHVPPLRMVFLVFTCDMISTISATWERKHVHNSGGRWTVRTRRMRVGLWVIGAFLAYLLVIPTLVPALAALTALFFGSGLWLSVRSADSDPRGYT